VIALFDKNSHILGFDLLGFSHYNASHYSRPAGSACPRSPEAKPKPEDEKP
jgi:hypothetical protein